MAHALSKTGLLTPPQRGKAATTPGSGGTSLRAPRLPYVLLALAIAAGAAAAPNAAAQTGPEATALASTQGAPKSETSPPDQGTKATSPAQQERFTEEVVVTATRTDLPLEQLPLSVSVLSEKQIQTAPVLALDDLLRAVPGLNMRSGNSFSLYPNYNTLSMRGLGAPRALVLLDGIPLTDAVFSSVQWNQVPKSEVERIEVVRGGASSLFGSYAMGGTVNIMTRPVTERSLFAEAMGGSAGTYSGNLSFGTMIAERLGLGLDVRSLHTDGYIYKSEAVRGPIDVPTEAEITNAQIRADYSAPSGTSAFVRVNAISEDHGLGTPLSRTEHDRVQFSTGTERQLTGGSRLAATLFYVDQTFQVDNTRITSGARESEYLTNRQTTPANDLGGSLTWSRAVDERIPLLVVGLDLRHVSADSTRQDFNQAGALTGTQWTGGVQDFGGVFAEASYLATERFELLASARVDYWKNRDGYDLREPGIRTYYPSRDTLQFSPRVALHYEMTATTGLHAAIYQAFRAPTLRELYRGTLSKTVAVLGNPDLEQEKLTGGDLGIHLGHGSLRGEINAFYNRVENLVGRTLVSQTSSLSTYRTVNIGATRGQGLELIGSVTVAPGLDLDLGYAFSDSVTADYPDDPRVEGKKTPDVARNAASLSCRYAARSGVALSAQIRFQSATFMDLTNVDELDAHTTVDLFASYPLTDTLELIAIAQNVLDEEYLIDVEDGGEFGPPRQLFAGVRFRLPLGRQAADARGN